ncbi:MAG: hypothetical protein WBA45_01915 [Microthrixaceae bacterium]
MDLDLEDALERHLREWGPVSWRFALGSTQTPVSWIGQLAFALSIIEIDSKDIAQKVSNMGVFKLGAVRDFNITWLAEESEHGRAFAALASEHGVNRLRFAPRGMARDVRSALAPIGLSTFRSNPRLALGVYFTHGAMQEYLAMTLYRALSRHLSGEWASVARAIGKQESRHFRFYNSGAVAALEGNSIVASIVRQTIIRLWRPPGIDVLGEEAWGLAFRPLIEDEAFREEVLRLDGFVQRWNGFEGAMPTKSFLNGLT